MPPARESCTGDFVIYPTGQAGATAQATILAYYNLYSECGGTVPEVDWQYNTGTGSTVSLAPAFSLDGSQVAFIQSNGTSASLVLLRYKLTTTGSGTLSTLTSQSTAAAYYNSGTGCTTPCMYTIALNGTPNDTWSDPYYDYGTDTLFVGDPSESSTNSPPCLEALLRRLTSGGWPAQMERGATTDDNQMASPVYDPNSGYVFVGSTTSVSATTGGYFYAVNASTGAIKGYSSTQLDKEYGIRDAPLLDPVAEKAYVFAGYNAGDDSAVYQFSATGFSGSTAPLATASLGTGADSDQAYIFAGTFDNTYYTSSSGSSPTGYLYVCGTGLADTLDRITITAGTMSTTPTTGPTLDNSGTYYPRCSPITEFYNSNVVVTPATTATGTITIVSNPAGWTLPVTVTVGATTYTFVAGDPTSNNEVEVSAIGFFGTFNEDLTADNLLAAIEGTRADCSFFTPDCITATQAANASATATVAGAVVSLTATASGTAGDFTLASSNTADITVSETDGANAVTGEDYLFLSVFASTETGCTNANTDGCVMSFDITTPSSFSTTTTPLGTLNVSAPTLNTEPVPNPAAPTSGIVIDNNGTAAGQSEIYFLTQDNSATTACVTGGADGICAIQASQAAP